MDSKAILTGFNQMIQAAAKVGDHDAAARMEVAREYFANPEFRAALQGAVWAKTSA